MLPGQISTLHHRSSFLAKIKILDAMEEMPTTLMNGCLKMRSLMRPALFIKDVDLTMDKFAQL